MVLAEPGAALMVLPQSAATSPAAGPRASRKASRSGGDEQESHGHPSSSPGNSAAQGPAAQHSGKRGRTALGSPEDLKNRNAPPQAIQPQASLDGTPGGSTDRATDLGGGAINGTGVDARETGGSKDCPGDGGLSMWGAPDSGWGSIALRSPGVCNGDAAADVASERDEDDPEDAWAMGDMGVRGLCDGFSGMFDGGWWFPLLDMPLEEPVGANATAAAAAAAAAAAFAPSGGAFGSAGSLDMMLDDQDNAIAAAGGFFQFVAGSKDGKELEQERAAGADVAPNALPDGAGVAPEGAGMLDGGTETHQTLEASGHSPPYKRQCREAATAWLGNVAMPSCQENASGRAGAGPRDASEPQRAVPSQDLDVSENPESTTAPSADLSCCRAHPSSQCVVHRNRSSKAGMGVTCTCPTCALLAQVRGEWAPHSRASDPAGLGSKAGGLLRMPSPIPCAQAPVAKPPTGMPASPQPPGMVQATPSTPPAAPLPSAMGFGPFGGFNLVLGLMPSGGSGKGKPGLAKKQSSRGKGMRDPERVSGGGGEGADDGALSQGHSEGPGEHQQRVHNEADEAGLASTYPAAASPMKSAVASTGAAGAVPHSPSSSTARSLGGGGQGAVAGGDNDAGGEAGGQILLSQGLPSVLRDDTLARKLAALVGEDYAQRQQQVHAAPNGEVPGSPGTGANGAPPAPAGGAPLANGVGTAERAEARNGDAKGKAGKRRHGGGGAEESESSKGEDDEDFSDEEEAAAQMGAADRGAGMGEGGPHAAKDKGVAKWAAWGGLGGESATVPKLGPNKIGENLRTELIAFAEAVATHDQAKVAALMLSLRSRANPQGDPFQRVAYYFLEGLWARTCGTGASYYNLPLLVSQPEMTDSVTKVSFRMPYGNFMTTVANNMFLDATRGEAALHVLDLGLWYTRQWPEFFRSLAARGRPIPSVRLTKMEVPPQAGHVHKHWDFSEQYRRMVEAAAERYGVPLEYRALRVPLQDMRPGVLQLRPQREALLVNAAMRLHTLQDGSVVRSSPRDAALKAVHRLQPRVMVLAEKHVDHNGPFFLRRFGESLDYYSSLFEALDAGLERSSAAREMFEKQILGREIINVVACEGLERVHRTERQQQWVERMREVGFVPLPVARCVKESAGAVLARHPRQFGLKDDGCALALCWKGRPILAVSGWRVAS